MYNLSFLTLASLNHNLVSRAFVGGAGPALRYITGLTSPVWRAASYSSRDFTTSSILYLVCPRLVISSAYSLRLLLPDVSAIIPRTTSTSAIGLSSCMTLSLPSVSTHCLNISFSTMATGYCFLIWNTLYLVQSAAHSSRTGMITSEGSTCSTFRY